MFGDADLTGLKDGPEGATVASRLEQMEVGTDEDGDAISSCIVVEVDADNIERPKAKRKLTDRQKLALDVLADLAIDGKPLPPEWQMPADIKAVDICTWKEGLFSRGVLDREAKNPRTDFRDLKAALQARQLIAEKDGLIWKAT